MAINKFTPQESTQNTGTNSPSGGRTNYNKPLIGFLVIVFLVLLISVVVVYLDRQKDLEEMEKERVDVDVEEEDTRDLSDFKKCDSDSDCILISDCVRKVDSVNEKFEEEAVEEMQKYLSGPLECFISFDFFEPKCENSLCTVEKTAFHESPSRGVHPATAEETLDKIIEELEQENIREITKYVVPEASVLAINPDGSINQDLIESLKKAELHRKEGDHFRSFLVPDHLEIRNRVEIFMYRPEYRWIITGWDVYD